MAYFKDLSPYSYRAGPDVVSLPPHARTSNWPFLTVEDSQTRVNIGWLGCGRFGRRIRFPTGDIADDVVDALIDVIDAQAVNLTRGFHGCEFCRGSAATGQLRLQHAGRAVLVGNGEIRVPAPDGLVFAAPTLIGHYVRDHHYCPPTAFVDALTAYRHDTADLALGWIPSSPELEDSTNSPKG